MKCNATAAANLRVDADLVINASLLSPTDPTSDGSTLAVAAANADTPTPPVLPKTPTQIAFRCASLEIRVE
ncbi:MAG TPA: hypothetical protein VJ890_16020 [Vineibacter sp.]|nr:hypothetical protein [Vineibacter sp.]